MPRSKRHVLGKISGLLSPTSIRIPQLYLVYALGFAARLLLKISFHRRIGGINYTDCSLWTIYLLKWCFFTDQQISHTFWLFIFFSVLSSYPRLLFPIQILHPQGQTQISSYVCDCPWSLQHTMISPSGTLSVALNHIFLICFIVGAMHKLWHTVVLQCMVSNGGRKMGRREDQRKKENCSCMHYVKVFLNFHCLV